MLIKFPKTIFKLKNLEFLNIGENKISEISPKIKNMKKLASLNLANNQLTTLPEEISMLKNLKTLIITGNSIPKEQIEKLQKQMPETQIFF